MTFRAEAGAASDFTCGFVYVSAPGGCRFLTLPS